MDFDVDREALGRLGVRLVVVFGSRARGRASARSDLDVGVLPSPDAEDVDAVADAIHANAPVDLVRLDLADPLLLREAALDGTPVFESHEGAWEEFRLLAFKRYMDTQWMRDIEAAAVERRFG